MDIENLRKNQTPGQLRIRELKKQQAQLFREQKRLAVEWNDELVDRNKTQTSNVRGMKVAVFLSTQPGQIDYKQTPPDVMQGADYKRRTAALESLQERIDNLRSEIVRMEKDEAARNARGAETAKAGR